ncbi:MAG: hypothetical protein WC781_05035 [Candidatus Pacearchaeota archaeon]|jgi:hypothetical protein
MARLDAFYNGISPFEQGISHLAFEYKDDSIYLANTFRNQSEITDNDRKSKVILSLEAAFQMFDFVPKKDLSL